MHHRATLPIASALAAFAFAAHAAPGYAPPLPALSAQANVNVMPGMNPAEMKRSVDSHKQRDKKRDWTLDDSANGFVGDGGGTPSNNGNGKGSATAPGQQKKR